MAGRHHLHAFSIDRAGQDCGGGGAVTGHVRGLARHLFDHLRAHVLELVFQFDLFGHGHTVLGDYRRAEGLLNDHVTTLGT